MLVELLVQLIENSCCCSLLQSRHWAFWCTDARIFIAYFVAQSRSKTHAKFIRHLCLHNPSHSPHCKIHHANYAMCGLPMQLCKRLYVPSTMQSICNWLCDGLCGVDWKAVCAVTCIFICLHSFWHWQCPSYSPSHSDYTRVSSAEATIKGATTTWPREHITETHVPTLS